MIEVAEDFEDYLQYLEEKRRRSRERSASRQVESWLCSCLILSFFGAFARLTLESPSFRRDSLVHVVQEQRVRVVAEVTNASFDMGALGVAVLRSWKSPYWVWSVLARLVLCVSGVSGTTWRPEFLRVHTSVSKSQASAVPWWSSYHGIVVVVTFELVSEFGWNLSNTLDQTSMKTVMDASICGQSRQKMRDNDIALMPVVWPGYSLPMKRWFPNQVACPEDMIMLDNHLTPFDTEHVDDFDEWHRFSHFKPWPVYKRVVPACLSNDLLARRSRALLVTNTIFPSHVALKIGNLSPERAVAPP
jgi:hypothetical protein